MIQSRIEGNTNDLGIRRKEFMWKIKLKCMVGRRLYSYTDKNKIEIQSGILVSNFNTTQRSGRMRIEKVIIVLAVMSQL